MRLGTLLLPTLGMAALLSVSCSDRLREEEPDREALCIAHCAQTFSECNPSPPSQTDGPTSEEECQENCLSDVAWTGECRFKHGEKMECSTSLSCEEFALHQTDVLKDPCLETENEWASCI